MLSSVNTKEILNMKMKGSGKEGTETKMGKTG
jgi:hypothetical protein